MRILSQEEVAEIRANLDKHDGRVAGGFTLDAIRALCDTVDELRRLLAGRAPTS